MQHIDRREALRRLSLLVGGTLSASTVSAVLAGCSAPDGYGFQTLSHDQRDLVAELAETIIPTTDTPGARAARVHEFIDLILSDWMRPAERGRFMEGLVEFSGAFEAQHSMSFVDAGVTERMAFMEPLDEAGVAARQNGVDPLPFFATLKELVVSGYYTSEIGASQELRHQMVFAEYDGDVEWKEGDRAFS